jgi:Cft2 family RNA processing exonuclease
MQPMGSVSLGKYWMPFDSRPLGLDVSIELMTLKLPFFNSGHLAGSSDQVIVTCGANLFYAF